MIAESVTKAALYLAVQFGIGIAAVHWILLPLAGPVSEQTRELWERTFTAVAFAAAILALAGLSARVFAHTAATFGAADTLQWDNLKTIAVESRWGGAWRRQMLAALALLAGALLLRIRRPLTWILYSVAALALVVSIPLLGHGNGTNARFALHVLHVLAISIWLGSLWVAGILHWRNTDVTPLLRRFSMVALPSAAVVVATGILLASIYIGSISNLFYTSYGQTLLLKLLAFAGILAYGWRNWLRAKAGKPARASLLMGELTFAFLVIVITSFLTEMEHP